MLNRLDNAIGLGGSGGTFINKVNGPKLTTRRSGWARRWDVQLHNTMASGTRYYPCPMP